MGKEIVIKFKIDGITEEVKNLNDLDKAILKVESDLKGMDFGSDAFAETSKQLDSLKKKYEDFSNTATKSSENAQKAASNTAKKTSENVTKAGDSIVKFAQGATDAIAGLSIIMGSSEKSAEEFQKTFQQGVAISMAVKGAIEAVVVAQELLTLAMEANPFGAILAVITALVIGIAAVMHSMSAGAQAVKAATEEYEKQKKVLELLKAQNEAQLIVIDAQINLMKVQKKSQKEINEKLEERYQIQHKTLEQEQVVLKQAVQVAKANLSKTISEQSFTEAMMEANEWVYKKIAAVQEMLGFEKAAADANAKAAEFEKVRIFTQKKRFQEGMDAVKLATAAAEKGAADLIALDLNYEAEKKGIQNESVKNFKEKEEKKSEILATEQARRADIENTAIDNAEKAQKTLHEKLIALQKNLGLETPEDKLRAKAAADAKELEMLYEKTSLAGGIELGKAQELADAKLLIQQNLDAELEKNQDTEDAKKAAKRKAALEEEKKDEDDLRNAKFAIAKASNDSLQGLSDLYFSIRKANMQKDSAEALKSAKNQFKINKALSISSTIIAGIQGVVNALTAKSTIPEPYGTILRVANAVSVGIASAANVAKIAATQFDGGGSSGSPATSSTSSTSSTAGASGGIQNTGASSPNLSLFSTGNSSQSSITPGQQNGQNVQTIKAYVVESEITNSQRNISNISKITI